MLKGMYVIQLGWCWHFQRGQIIQQKCLSGSVQKHIIILLLNWIKCVARMIRLKIVIQEIYSWSL